MISGNDNMLDINIPVRYAKWKLGYGPGSAEAFLWKRRTYWTIDPSMRNTQRKERHTTKLEKQKAAIFVPRRCEVADCERRGDDVKTCGRCSCAYYCGKEHQSQDWKRHKLDCKALAKLEVEFQPKPFESSEELKKYPIGCFPLSAVASTLISNKCFICHSKSKEVDICHTTCMLQSPSLR